MSLHIEKLRFHAFRSYEDLVLDGLGELVIVVGPNAVGKTNLVEGVQLLTAGASFRAPKWRDLVSWDADACEISLELVDGPRCIEHALVVEQGRHAFLVNGKKKGVAAFSEVSPSVLFNPDDLQLVKMAGARRRAEVDGIGAQLSKPYGKLLDEYARCLRQRNQLFKEERVAPGVMESWTEALVGLGARLCASRWRLFTRIARKMEELYAQVAPGERLSALYLPSWHRFGADGRQRDDFSSLAEVEAVAGVGGEERVLSPSPAGENEGAQSGETSPIVENIAYRLRKLADCVRESELRRRTSLVGPHKDEIVFFIDGRNARSFASQGQQRTIVLVEKLAALAVFEDMLGEKPFLLLDDVMSELDESRRETLTALLSRTAQTFITTTNIGYFSPGLLASAQLVEIAGATA